MRSAAANRINNFDRVVFAEHKLAILAAWHDVAVDFNGDALVFQAQQFNQPGKAGCFLQSVVFAIDSDIHSLRILHYPVTVAAPAGNLSIVPPDKMPVFIDNMP